MGPATREAAAGRRGGGPGRDRGRPRGVGATLRAAASSTPAARAIGGERGRPAPRAAPRPGSGRPAGDLGRGLACRLRPARPGPPARPPVLQVGSVPARGLPPVGPRPSTHSRHRRLPLHPRALHPGRGPGPRGWPGRPPCSGTVPPALPTVAPRDEHPQAAPGRSREASQAEKAPCTRPKDWARPSFPSQGPPGAPGPATGSAGRDPHSAPLLGQGGKRLPSVLCSIPRTA